MTTFKPETAAQAADVVRHALSVGEPLEIRGAASKRGLGRPVQAAMTLDTTGLDGILAYEPEELTLTVRAGTPMRTIGTVLSERRQRLAFEPPDLGGLLGGAPGRATIGGIIGCNLAGPRRIKDGAARDHLLGCEAVNGRGEAYKTGGRVVKNVTGYDLCKLLTGSYGTLSLLTELTVKVLPVPDSERTHLVYGLDDRAALSLLSDLLGSAVDLSGAAHLPASVARRSAVAPVAAAGQPVTALRLEGCGPSVAARSSALAARLDRHDDGACLDGAESASLWTEIRDVACFAGTGPRTVWRLSVRPGDGARTVADLRRLGEVDAFYDWGGGLLWVEAPAEIDAASVRAVLAPNRGHATLVRGSEALRSAADVFQPLPAALAALTGRVKDGFDPKRILNPGRMHAWL